MFSKRKERPMKDLSINITVPAKVDPEGPKYGLEPLVESRSASVSYIVHDDKESHSADVVSQSKSVSVSSKADTVSRDCIRAERSDVLAQFAQKKDLNFFARFFCSEVFRREKAISVSENKPMGLKQNRK